MKTYLLDVYFRTFYNDPCCTVIAKGKDLGEAIESVRRKGYMYTLHNCMVGANNN